MGKDEQLTSLRWLSGFASVLLSIVCMSLGCNQAAKPVAAKAGDGGSARTVQLQLNWLPDAQHGGFYAAKAAGYFSNAGLDVTLVPGGPGTAVLPKVAMGRCDFAIANADQVLLARAQGADVVAVFAAMQNSPRCIMVHDKAGIDSLEQLKNMTLALGDGKAFAEYLKSKVPLTNVRIVSYTGSVAKFLVDDDFGQQGYVFSEPVLAKLKGGDPKAIMVSDLGFNPYSSVVVTRRELWESEPELVTSFVNVITQGWELYLESPTDANGLIQAANDNLSQDATLSEQVLSESAAAIKELCQPEGASLKLGTMRLERWEQLRNQLVELKLLPGSSPPAASAFIEL